jgi:hypothetical protein
VAVPVPDDALGAVVVVGGFVVVVVGAFVVVVGAFVVVVEPPPDGGAVVTGTVGDGAEVEAGTEYDGDLLTSADDSANLSPAWSVSWAMASIEPRPNTPTRRQYSTRVTPRSLRRANAGRRGRFTYRISADGRDSPMGRTVRSASTNG